MENRFVTLYKRKVFAVCGRCGSLNLYIKKKGKNHEDTILGCFNCGYEAKGTHFGLKDMLEVTWKEIE